MFQLKAKITITYDLRRDREAVMLVFAGVRAGLGD